MAAVTINNLSLSGLTNSSINDMFRSAAESGDKETFQCLLFNQEVDVYQKDCNGTTVLMLVAENGLFECLKCLVETNKIDNINEYNEVNETALILAAAEGHTDCVRCLIDTGLADVDICDRNGKTAFHLVAQNGHVECLKYLLDASIFENINERCSNHITALMLAAMNGHTGCVWCLIDIGLADVNLCDRNGKTAFHLAAENGHVECLKYLLDANIIENINQCIIRNNTTALMFAAMNGHTECVRCLIDTGLADVNRYDWVGRTAFHLAVTTGHVECLKCLLDSNKIENIDQCDRYDNTALMLAAMYGHTECVRCLIDTGQVDVNLCQENGNTALIIAARDGYTECVRYLIDTGRADVNRCNKTQNTALMFAAEEGHTECVRCLIDTGLADVYHCNKTGETALMLTAMNGHNDCVKYLVEANKIENINHCSVTQQTALIYAASNGRTECVRCLIDTGLADVNRCEQNQRTALMFAAMNGHTESVELLLSHDNADANIRDKEGRTALMLAIWHFRHACVECLISNSKVDVELCDKEGMTAFMLTVKMSNYHILRCFLDIKLTEEVDERENDMEGDQKKDKSITEFSLPYTDGSVRFYPGITWRRPYIYGRDQEGKSVLKLVIRKGLHRCVVCFLLAGINVPLLDNVSCSHTLLDKRKLYDSDEDRQTSLISAVQRRNFKNLEYLIQYERIRLHILVILLRQEFFATGTISLVFHKRLCSSIRNLKDIDQFLLMMCNDDKIKVCLDYLLSAFICQIDSSHKSALSLATHKEDPSYLEFLLEHVLDKKVMYDHIEISCKEFPDATLNFHSLMVLLKLNIFLWEWYPRCNRDKINLLTRELVIRGFAPGCFEWQGKQYSPVHFAFMSGDEGLIRYLVANLYFTSCDLLHVQRDTQIWEHLQEQGSRDLQQLYQELCGTTWRLETQSLLTISNCLRNNRNRHGMEEVQSLLPEIFRFTLPSINPMRMICQRQWADINLDFMNHRLSWSLCGRNLYEGNCCNSGCLKFEV